MQRNGLSSVYGFVALFFLTVTSIYAIIQLTQSQSDLSNSLNMQEQRIQEKNLEKVQLYRVNSTLFVSNSGATPSRILYLVLSYNNTSRLLLLNQTIMPGQTLSLNIGTRDENVGVITSLGNTFMLSQTVQTASQCQSSTLAIYVNPSGSGYTVPSGTQKYCNGQTVTLQAYPNQGYSFSSWTGSISSTSNPVTITITGNTVVYANFVPYITLSVYPLADGFEYNQQVTRYADILVYGPSQQVTLSAQSVPSGVTVSFSPQTLQASTSGSHSLASITYKSSSYSSNLTFSIVATSQYGRTVSKSYTVSQTPQDYLEYGGIATRNGYPIIPNNYFPPRIHYTSTVTSGSSVGIVTFWTAQTFQGGISDIFYSLSTYNPNSCTYCVPWTSTMTQATYWACYGDVPIDTFATGNQIFVVTTGHQSYPQLTLNYGFFNGQSISWKYKFGNSLGTSGCGVGIALTGTKYNLASAGFNDILSVAQDNAGNIYVAVETMDSSYNFHIEVLEISMSQLQSLCPSSCSSVSMSNVFISPGYSSAGYYGYYALTPQLVPLSNGYVALVINQEIEQSYRTMYPCTNDDVYLSTNHGASWSKVGSFAASGSPLCAFGSSVTGIKDTIVAGGINNAGQLTYWAYNTTSGRFFSPSSPIATPGKGMFGYGPNGAVTSIGNSIIVLAYVDRNGYLNMYSFNAYNLWTGQPSQQIVNNKQLITGSTYSFYDIGETIEMPLHSYFTVPLAVLGEPNQWSFDAFDMFSVYVQVA